MNGSTGIAVGMATNIPPHNLGEVIDGVCLLIDNPDASLEQLMECIKGPRLPTAGIIMGRAGIRAAYGTGRGKITVRARAEIVENEKTGRFSIVVTELPYQVNKARLIESIADLVKEKRVEGIADINDYSSREGMRMVIDLKRDANPQVVLNYLYQYTQLQISYGIIQLALVNGEPKTLTLKQILEQYIAFQCEVITRRTQYDLKKAKDREHIFGRSWRAPWISWMKSSPPSARARAVSPKRKPRSWKNSISTTCRLPPSSPTVSASSPGLRSAKFWYERDELLRKIAEFEDILSSDARVHEIVKTELCAIRDKFADERRTEIVGVSGEVDIEDLIPRGDLRLHAYKYGLHQAPECGHLSDAAPRRQGHQGHDPPRGGHRRDHVHLLVARLYHVLYVLRARLPLKGLRDPRGQPPKPRDEHRQHPAALTGRACHRHAARAPTSAQKRQATFAWSRNTASSSAPSLTRYKNIRKNGIAAINLDEGDELCWVKLTDGNQKLMIATKKGMSIAFHEADARCIGRTARGVKAITLGADDVVAGMCVLDPEKEGADRHRNRLRQTKRRFQLPHPVARRQGAHQLPYRALWRCGSHHNGRAR